MTYWTMSKHLDAKATAANAAAVLEDYTHQRSRAKAYEFVGGQNFDGMPRSKTVDNTNERVITNRIGAAEFVALCDQIIEDIRHEPFYRVDANEVADVLKYAYFRPLPTVAAIQDRLNISAATYHRRKQAGLIAFAESWPPTWGSLLVYKNGDD